MKRIFIFVIILITLTACTASQTQAAAEPAATDISQAGMSNPASVYCTQQGNKLEIRTAADGSQNGICIFQMAAHVTTGLITGENADPQYLL